MLIKQWKSRVEKLMGKVKGKGGGAKTNVNGSPRVVSLYSVIMVYRIWKEDIISYTSQFHCVFVGKGTR